MKELHIPYGLQRLTREIIEPEDAERGRACNCLCPVCEAPLLSRHPKSDEKRIHFAHDSKHPDAKPIDECPLSPYVALGMMLRHMAETLTGKTIKLTSYYKHLMFNCCTEKQKMLHVIGETDSIIDGVERAPSLGGVVYDLRLSIGGKSYFVDLVYPGKPKKEIPAAEPLTGIGGIFCISGPEFTDAMERVEFAKTRYSDAVCRFLLSHSRKFWEYHYLEVDLTKAEQAKHVCRPDVDAFARRKRVNYQTPTYTPKYSTYGRESYTPAQTSPDQIKSTQEAAEAYLRASTGDTGIKRFKSNAQQEQQHVAIYEDHERSSLLPSPFQLGGNEPNQRVITQSYRGEEGTGNYECVFCSVKYSSQNGSTPNCPKCKGHLGARPI